MIKNEVTYLSDDKLERLFPSIPATPKTSSVSREQGIESAFEQLKSKMQEAIEGKSEQAIYLMGADCGTGKSRSIQSFIRKQKLSKFPGSGIFVFVDTLSEIDAYVTGSGLERLDYAIYSPDLAYKTYGRGLHGVDEAPVLFATHSMAKKRTLEVGSFEAASCFHYQGKPRGLRIWEERFAAAEGATFELDELYALPSALKALPKTDRQLLWRLIHDCAKPVAGLPLGIPLALIEVADRALKADLKITDGPKRTLAALAILAGSTAYMKGGDDGGWHFIGIGRTLPPDIGPLFVLDASARLTSRYKALPAHGFKVVELQPATLNYERLKVRWWDKAAGKTALRNKDDRTTLFKGIADAANSKPTEAFLVVLAKEFCGREEEGKVSVPPDLSSMILNPERISIVNWGRHVGTNDFREVPNIVIVSAYNYGDKAYDALALASSANRLGQVSLVARHTQVGEILIHNVYQAVCRGKARMCDGAVAGEATAYLIMRDTTETRNRIAQAFPGCSIGPWTPCPPTKEKKHDLILRTLLDALGSAEKVSFKSLTEACGGRGESYLTKIVKAPKFTEAMKAHGIFRRANAFVRTENFTAVLA